MKCALIMVFDNVFSKNGYSLTKKAGLLSALQRMAIVLNQAGAESIAIATTKNVDQIEQNLREVGVSCQCFHTASADGRAKDLDATMEYLQNRCDFVLLVRADMPLFSEDTARDLWQNETVAVPVCGDALSWPLLVPVSSLGRLYSPEALDELPEKLLPEGVDVPVSDKGALIHLDEEDFWESLLEEYRISHFRPVTKLTVARENVFLGPGTHQLLCALRDTSSLRGACEQMGLSYSKGWRMIQNLEYQICYEVVSRHKGGQAGGYSYLSPRGEQLLDDYSAYIRECNEAIRPIFEKYFGNI